ncbi:uncharacterized protein DSM5745_03983 [Aspergillus mulundensis]|uniref:Protein kinase domain-containing protein n=1 Tax=Aspergillus mulundensis TaxID=1810919 RepID=A0A3D8SBC9_9EURO|nr:Uncharacterized protein DSM5745_03983 [Aspergillus mulundensis]RDW83657.1 Uncharacterized protein DSM5745_03983 [Aspergillus mulundensis]
MGCMWSSTRAAPENEAPNQQNTISIGLFATIHRLSDGIVRKIPCSSSDSDGPRAAHIEAIIYRHLGNHRRIARCLHACDDYIDLKYEPYADAASFLGCWQVPSGIRYQFARQAVEAVHYIHGKGVIHSDLAARQFLVDETFSLRLSDFGGSSLHGGESIIVENATHFLPRDCSSPTTVQSDLFALGSTLYEILVGQKPYGDLSDEEKVLRLYSSKVFPNLDAVTDGQWRAVITGCWMTQYRSASEILNNLPPQSLTLRLFLFLWKAYHRLRRAVKRDK